MNVPSQVNGRRVLVVGINFSPEHTGIAPYTSQACAYLAEAGAEVLVLSGVPHYPEWRVPAEYRFRFRRDETHGGVSVRRLRHWVPTRQTAITRMFYEATFGVHAGVQRLPWKPHVVLGVTPSLLGAVAAAIIARRHGVPLVLWIQDLMGEATTQTGIPGGHRLSRATSAIERWTSRRASSVLIVSDAFREHLLRLGVDGERIHTVPNWTHVPASRRGRGLTRKQMGWSDDELVALHTGNMGLKQGLENVVEAARRAGTQDAKVRFVLVGDGSQRHALEVLGANVPNLDILGPVAGEDYPAILAAADILLVNERPSVTDMSLPSKLTSYFSAGRPVVAAVPEGGGTARELLRSGAGRFVAAGNPQALFEAVLALGNDHEARQALGQSAAIHARDHLKATSSLDRIAGVIAEPVAPTAGRSGGADPA